MNYDCDIENAPKFADWIKNRGGVAWWRSVNLSNPSASWSTPALTDGKPTPRPTWQADSTPEIITDPAKIGVYETRVLEKVEVKLKVGSGMMAVLTQASQNRLDKAMRKHGSGHKDTVFYRRSGDLMFPEMEVCESVDLGSLKDWMAANREDQEGEVIR